MAKKLVIVSDMWGTKKGLWITSYLGYLQQYFDITFYDSQQLANLDLAINSEENIHKAFVEGGIDTAVAHLLKKEKNSCYYLGFGIGGTIIWNAAKKGLPVKSLYGVSAIRIRLEQDKPCAPFTLLYGENDSARPDNTWASSLGVEMEIFKNFGHTLYTDEKVIKKVCMDLLGQVTQMVPKEKKVV